MVYSVWKPVLFIFILISLSVSSWGQGVILFNNYIDIEELGNPFQHPEWGLYYLNPFTPNAPPVQFAQGMMSSPVLSPDGSTLVFAAPHIKIQKAIGLYSVPVSGGIPTVISHMIGEAGNPSFSPDGSMVVYEVFLPGSGGGQPTPTPTQGLPLQPGPGNSLLKPQQGDFIFPAANPFIALPAWMARMQKVFTIKPYLTRVSSRHGPDHPASNRYEPYCSFYPERQSGYAGTSEYTSTLWSRHLCSFTGCLKYPSVIHSHAAGYN